MITYMQFGDDETPEDKVRESGADQAWRDCVLGIDRTAEQSLVANNIQLEEVAGIENPYAAPEEWYGHIDQSVLDAWDAQMDALTKEWYAAYERAKVAREWE